ncbi:hypothetical protein GE21DRAFT_1045763 [Neurospora crassa]|nr:hypothetical protein GE21DRAFT_1045763 [Neurospora crassa]
MSSASFSSSLQLSTSSTKEHPKQMYAPPRSCLGLPLPFIFCCHRALLRSTAGCPHSTFMVERLDFPADNRWQWCLVEMHVRVPSFPSPSFPAPPGPLFPSSSARLLLLSTLCVPGNKTCGGEMFRKAVLRNLTASTAVPFPPARVKSKNQDRLCHCHTIMPHCLV